MTHKYISENHDFRIEVVTNFDFDQSNPLNYEYLFQYTITITNIGKIPAQLHSRKWSIKDGKGEVRFVEGPGVVGNTPHFKAGESFSYSSFCPLKTMTGEMWGHFNMTDAKGAAFKIDTPLFKFHVPDDFIDNY